MKLRVIMALGILFFVSQVNAQEKLVLKNQKEKISYSIGLNIGRNLGSDLKKQSIDIDPNLVAKGIQDALSGANPLLSNEEIQETMVAFQKEMSEKQKQRGEAFLAENKKKEGVKTLPSGLQYKVVKAGSGKKPKLDDTVTVQYRGTLIDGTEFDSSFRRGQPATFPVSGVIPGWTEALPLMEEGAKWQLFIPPKLAYGERGAGGLIGPNATLIFEVELVSIQENKQGKKQENKK
ncbi:MAG: FKBP-type peptidyl-prolyl cis-trans isomerase [Deltaproteobacteria bacterium]|jgi:FKBP-type peptidyl-prolyl cis-trans isomerase FklB|nr:FKBP-type peptidyl-prolyl cis-trans isomerase [Deltaproteobacteria bacterium]